MRKAKHAGGRPPLPKGEAKGAVLSLRLTESEREAVERAATKAGQRASDWAREILALVATAGAHAVEQP